MKKGGIIAAIIIIFIFFLIFFGIECIKERLPKPKFGDIYDFKFDKINSTKNLTYILAKFNISNSNKDDLTINVSYENIKGSVKYDNQKIGTITLDTNKDIKDLKGKVNIIESSKRVSATIKGGGTAHFNVLFNLSNENLSKIFYNHTMKNDEHGKIKFILNFTVKIYLPLNITVPINKNITIKTEKEIITDILEKLDWMKYNKPLNETSILNYTLKNSTCISMMKKSESNVIQFNHITRILEKKKPLLDLYIGDNFYWITNTQPLNIGIGQEMILYGKPLVLFFINILFPFECKIYVNDIPFGNGTIQPVERKYIRTNSQRIEALVVIKGEKFGEWIYSHIKNSENTTVNITFTSEKLDKLINKFPFIHLLLPSSYGENNTIFIFNSSLSDLIDKIELPGISFDLSNIKNDLSNYQLLTLVIIINTILVLIILYFAFWKEEKYLIFKKK